MFQLVVAVLAAIPASRSTAAAAFTVQLVRGHHHNRSFDSSLTTVAAHDSKMLFESRSLTRTVYDEIWANQ